MHRGSLLLLALLLLSGCESLNDAFVRRWFNDPGMSRKVRDQIEEGLERRKETPPGQRQLAPPFMDQGQRERGFNLPEEELELALLRAR